MKVNGNKAPNDNSVDVQITLVPGEVPCNGCVACCRGDAVRLSDADRADGYLTEPYPHAPRVKMLAHKPNGDCIYLGESGCTIYDRRPTICREMDCRLLADYISKRQAKQKARDGLLRMAVWERGKELLEQAFREAGA